MGVVSSFLQNMCVKLSKSRNIWYYEGIVCKQIPLCLFLRNADALVLLTARGGQMLEEVGGGQPIILKLKKML